MDRQQMIAPQIAVLPVVAPREYTANLPKALADLREGLEARGCQVLMPEQYLYSEGEVIERFTALEIEADLVVFFAGTWFYAPAVVTPARRAKKPCLLWSMIDIPNFALGGAVVANYSLREMGISVKFLAGAPDEVELLDAVANRARAAAVANKLDGAKIGCIGGKSMGMYNANLDEFYWKKTTGLDIIHIDTYQIIRYMDRLDEDEVTQVLERVKRSVGRIVDRVEETGETLNDEDLRVQCRIYLALQDIVDANNLVAIGNKCQPDMSSDYLGLGYTGCVSHALINDDGLPCTCESDMPATITMYIMSLLSGQTVYFGDLNSIVKSENVARFINCGFGPLSLAASPEQITLWPVGEAMGIPGKARGASTGFPLKAGRVTLAKIGGGGTTARIHIATGECLPWDMEPPGEWPTHFPQAPVRLDVNLMTFVQKAVGQHYILAYGDYERELVDLCDILGIEADL